MCLTRYWIVLLIIDSGLLYIRLRAVPSTGLIHVLLSPQSGPVSSNFCGFNLVTCEVLSLDFKSRCSWGESVVKRINLSWTNGRDVHYAMDEPNPTHVESSGRGKVRPDFFKPAQRFGTKIVPTRTPHGMSECFEPNPNLKPLARIWWNRAILLGLRVHASPQFGPKYKVIVK